jgi:predicted permease
MERIPRVRRWFRLPKDETTIGREIDDEIGFHLRARIAALEAAGVAPEAARRAAEREFGDVMAARAELSAIDRVTVRRRRRTQRWRSALWDARQAVRGMRRSPSFAAVVVLTLGLGIGVNAAMFGITDRLLLSPPAHVTAAAEVVRVLYRSTSSGTSEPRTNAMLPYLDYALMRDGVGSFASVAAYSSPSYSVLGRGREATELRVVSATASLFPTLGVRPALGRFFVASEDTPPQGVRVVVLSHGLWRGRFGGDPGVIGRTVEIDHATYEVVGVAPRGFAGIDFEPVHAWVPVSITGAAYDSASWHTSRSMHWLRMVARLAPGIGAEVARQEAAATFLAANERRFDGDPNADVVLGSVRAALAPEAGTRAGAAQKSGRIALWLLAVSLLVLVSACANVANLLLARGMRRRRDIGVLMALGIGRARLVRQVLTETLILALCGGVVGLLLAHWGGHVARVLLLPDVEWTGSPIDGRVLAFAASIACIAALLAGVAPALHALGVDAATLLRMGGRGTARRSAASTALVALQATLSVVLLAGAGLFVRSLQRAASVPLGFEPERVTTFQWHTAGLDWGRSRTQGLYAAALERVRALPEVEAAALGTSVPMWSALYASIRLPGQDSVAEPTDGGPYYSPVSADYFRTMGARVLRGRVFTDGDVAGSAPVAVVTASLARLLWPGEDAVGRCFFHGRDADGVCRTVVGVVEDTRYSSLEAEPTPMFFVPLAQEPTMGWRTLFVRFAGDTGEGIAAVRRALDRIEPGLPHVQATPLQTRVDPQIQPWRLGASLFSAFGALALLLVGIGLYGVVAYDVSQRRRELGIRLAIGARGRALVRMVLGQAMSMVVLGLVVGLALTGWAAGYVEPLLFQVSPRDPAVLVGVAALLFVIGVGAASVPAWRAARIRPTETLRED